MANKDLFKQAIADAKSIREAAIANAKLALEESLTPQLKELLAQRLAEMEEEEAPAAVVAEEATEEVAEESLEEAIGPDGLQAVAEAEEEGEEEGAEDMEGEEEAGDEAEGDSEESEDEAGEEEVGEMSVEELKDLIRDVLTQVMGDSEAAQEDELEADAEGMEDDDMTSMEPAQDDTEINIEELMAELAQTLDPAAAPAADAHGNLEEEEQIDELAEAAVKTVMEGLKETTHKYLRAMAEARGCSMEELVKSATRLGALSEMSKVSNVLNNMAELGQAAFTEAIGKLIPAEAAAPAMEEGAEEIAKKIVGMGKDAAKAVANAIGKAIDYTPIDARPGGRYGEGVEEAAMDEGAEEIVKKVVSMGKDAAKKVVDALGKAIDYTPIDHKPGGRYGEGVEEELSEALSTIETLRNELNETNLLNAKLLYVNKVFKANNLTESQKANVIAAFDKAETVKEVKLVYETVSENATATGKKEVVREAKGFASAATGASTKPAVIAEANAAVLRMQKLAGIIK